MSSEKKSSSKDMTAIEWQVEKMCTDMDDYELVIEKQKTDWQCEQNRESWKWLVSYHGSIVASGAGHSTEEAQKMALSNVPGNIDN